MATTTFEFPCFSGETITLKLYTEKTDTEVSSVAATERTNKKGYYTCSLVDVATGSYDWRAVSGSDTFVTGQIDHTNSAGLTEQPRGSNVRDDIGLATANLDTQLAAIQSNTGTGARLVTITVNDGATVLENARVRLQQGAESYVGNTNASGVITFSIDDATWSVRITKAGYTFTSTSIVVNGDEAQTYSMTSTAPAAPANPSMSTGYGYCYDENGDPEQGVEIFAYQTAGPGDAGYAWDSEEFTITSDINGLASHAFVRGGTYKVRRGEGGDEVTVTVPDAGSFQLPEVLGYA